MTFIRKHKFVIAICAIFVVFLSFGIIIIYNLLHEEDKYINRIEGIENVIISDSKIDNIKNKILEDKSISKITFRLDGALVKFFVEVKKDNSDFNIENMLNIILDNFEDDEKKFYDFQVYVTCEEKQKPYPMIAYKHCNNQTFTITKKEGSNNES